MSNIYNKNKNDNVFDTLSLILSDNKKEIKDIVLNNPEIAVENDFHLLTLACWCDNQDIVNFLLQDEEYFLNAFNNVEFSSHFISLKKFNPQNYHSINNKYQSLLMSMELNESIPLNDIDSEITKF